LSSNPRLLSLANTVRAAQHELDVVNGDGRARIDLELEASSNTYISANTRIENDARGMVVFSYSLFDAGNAEGEQREVEARIRQARARYTDTRDQVEADIRQAYRAIASARRKLGDPAVGSAIKPSGSGALHRAVPGRRADDL
jgi:outer membrane protein TolC